LISTCNKKNPQINIQCSGSCLVPTSAIQAIVNELFYSTVQQQVTSNINKYAQQKLDNIGTSIPLPWLGLTVNVESSYYMFNNNFVLACKGSVGSYPYAPTFAPPAAAFNTMSAPVNLYLTSYPTLATVYALNQQNFFKQSVKIGDTSNFGLKLAFPGLGQFPNCQASLSFALNNIKGQPIVVNINPSGIFVNFSARITMTVSNATFNSQVLVFDYANQPSINYDISVGSGNAISVTAHGGNSKASVTVVSTKIGNINQVLVINESNTLINKFNYTQPFTIGHTDLFTLSNLGHKLQQSYDLVTMDVSVNAN